MTHNSHAMTKCEAFVTGGLLVCADRLRVVRDATVRRKAT